MHKGVSKLPSSETNNLGENLHSLYSYKQCVLSEGYWAEHQFISDKIGSQLEVFNSF